VVYKVEAARLRASPLPRPFVRDHLAKARGHPLGSARVFTPEPASRPAPELSSSVDSRAGEIPIDVAAFWLAAALRDRCPPLAGRTGLRGPSMGLHPRTSARGYLTLLTLAPPFPVPSVRAVRRFRRTSSHGVFQITPVRRLRSRSPLPARLRWRTSSPAPSDRACHSPTMFRPRGFSPPRRLPPPKPRAHFQRASDPRVHRVSSSREAEFPAMLSCPSKRSLRWKRRAWRFPSPPAGSRHRAGPSLARRVHRVPCPLALSLRQHRATGFPAGWCVRSRGPKALLLQSGPLPAAPFPA